MSDVGRCSVGILAPLSASPRVFCYVGLPPSAALFSKRIIRFLPLCKYKVKCHPPPCKKADIALPDTFCLTSCQCKGLHFFTTELLSIRSLVRQTCFYYFRVPPPSFVFPWWSPPRPSPSLPRIPSLIRLHFRRDCSYTAIIALFDDGQRVVGIRETDSTREENTKWMI